MYRERRFDPSEASRILREAAELQARDGERTGTARSYTQAELRERAEALGIEARFVDRAVTGSGRDADVVEPSNWTGRPKRIAYERTLPGEVRRSAHAAIVTAIRRAAGDVGQTEVIGSTLTWRPSPQTMRQLTVSVVPDRGKTTLVVEERFDHLAGQIYGGLGGGLGGGGLGLVVPLLLVISREPIVVGMLLVVYLVAVMTLIRRFFHRRVDARVEALGKLVDALEREVAATSAAPAGRARIASSARTPGERERSTGDSEGDGHADDADDADEEEVEEIERASRASRRAKLRRA
jgi:hypothetical protein